MRLLCEVGTDVMIRAFVLAEHGSARPDRGHVPLLPREVVAAPDDDAPARTAREQWLVEQRGWPDRYMFRGLPAGTRWWCAELDATEPKFLASYDLYVTGTGGTRGPGDFAPDDATVERRVAALRPLGISKVTEYSNIVAAVRTYAPTINMPNQDVPACIYVAQSDAGPLVVLEGNSRAIARSMSQRSDVERAIVGISPSMDEWGFFGA